MSDMLGRSQPLVTPLYQSAVYSLPDLDVLEAICTGQERGFVYARDAHPNASVLGDTVARLEGGAWAFLCASGMAAISASIVPLLQAGDRVVASDRLYGRSTQLLARELSRFGITTKFVDTTDVTRVRTEVTSGPPAKVLLVETLSNPLLRFADVPALAQICQPVGCRLIVDNTFATPTLFRPLDFGADVVVESLTKLMGGHSDLTLGAVAGCDMNLRLSVWETMSIWGLASNPFDCWLASRGLETLDLRVRAATANAAQLAPWLAEQPGVSRVVYPGLPDHPDYEVCRRLLPEGAGNMLCFELSGGREAVNQFFRAAPGIPFCPSLGHTTTTCSYPWGTSHRHDSPEEKHRQGITEGLVRLSVGIESQERIRQEFLRGLAR